MVTEGGGGGLLAACLSAYRAGLRARRHGLSCGDADDAGAYRRPDALVLCLLPRVCGRAGPLLTATDGTEQVSLPVVSHEFTDTSVSRVLV